MLTFLGGIALTGTVVGVMLLADRQWRAAFARAAERDPECVAYDAGGFTELPHARFDRGDTWMRVSAIVQGSGRSKTALWEVSGSTVPLGKRVNFEVSRENLLSKALGAAGLKDIQLGDERLDKLLHIKGSDEDLVRAILLTPDVTSCLVRFFVQLAGAGKSYQQVTLHASGGLTVRSFRSGLSYDDVRGLADVALGLHEALSKLDDIAPIRARLDAAAGGASGAPVGVSLLS